MDNVVKISVPNRDLNNVQKELKSELGRDAVEGVAGRSTAEISKWGGGASGDGVAALVFIGSATIETSAGSAPIEASAGRALGSTDAGGGGLISRSNTL
jgi:hypothetical protein